MKGMVESETKTAEPAAPAPAPGHGLTPKQYEACMRVSEKWPQPAHRDGWVLAHNAIRLDMRDFANAIATCVSQGGNLTPWQVDVIQNTWKAFEHQVHHHHDNEERLFFPFMATRVTLPPKMSADHKVMRVQRHQFRSYSLIEQYTVEIIAVSCVVCHRRSCKCWER
jgi:hypothetical protein